MDRGQHVDFFAGQFADRVPVTGSLNGVSVLPTLTNGTDNYVSGNTAYGDAGSNNTAAGGNVGVTFTSAIDTASFVHGDHSMPRPIRASRAPPCT